MPPPTKRKRGDAHPGGRDDRPHRPSPHRPQYMETASHGDNYRGRGGRRGNSYSNRGGRGGAHHANANGPHSQQPTQATSSNTTTTNAPPSSSPPASATSTNNTSSQPPQISTTNEPQIPTNPSARKLRPLDFTYEFLTDKVVSDWPDAGRQEFMQRLNGSFDDDVSLALISQEVVRAAVEERLPATELGSAMKESFGSAEAPYEDLVELLLDAISAVTMNVDARNAVDAIRDVPNPKAIRELLIAIDISSDVIRDNLELYVLMACGFVRTTFERATVRYGTNQLYRQNAYNLLREESEGYSKLLTEYFNTNALTDTRDMPTDDLVVLTHGRVKALIGGFDLDVGRVLDVTLDVFANSLVKHYKFFVKYLRSSSWWPAKPVWDDVSWSEEPLSTLPPWAELESPAFEVPQVREDILNARQLRDVQFWDRVREVGIQAWTEIGSRRLLDPADKEKFPHMEWAKPKNEKDKSEIPVEIENNNYIHATGMMPPSGSRTAAQLLGFKLRFYSSAVRDASDVLSENLIILTALLIKIGFISLRDLFHHLYPDEEEMEKVKAKLQEEKEERERKARPGGGALNALAMAGALKDDDEPMSGRSGLPGSRLREIANGASTPRSAPAGNATTALDSADSKTPQESLPAPVNQVYTLLKALLLIGAIPESLFLLGKYPWMIDLHPDMPKYINRLLDHCISKLWNASKPLAERATLRERQHAGVSEQSGLPKGQLAPVELHARPQKRWLWIETQNYQGTDFDYYWDEWIDNVPVCQTVEDLFPLCDTLLNLVGPKIGREGTLLAKLVSISTHSLAEDKSEANFKRWLLLTKRVLVPAVSVVEDNPTLIKAVWQLVKLWPTAVRYNIYAEWIMGPTSRTPDVASAASLAVAHTKDILKRISKENTKDSARKLAKIACSNPGPVFNTILNQIESYDNMIDSVAKCCRFLTDMGYEILTWSLMQALSSVGRGRNRVQEDGMLTSAWLQALSKFAATMFRDYQFSLNPTTLLLYVANQIRLGNTTDLEVLQQLTSNITGFTTEIVYNDKQIRLLAGGKDYVKRVFDATQDHRSDKSIVSRSRTFISRLTATDETPQAALTQLIIAMAQEMAVFEYRENMQNAPLKVLSINTDRIFDILRTFLDAMQWHMDIKRFAEHCPDLISLIKEYGIPTEIAWMISRQQIRTQLEEADAEFAASKKAAAAVVEEVDMTDAPTTSATETDDKEAVSKLPTDATEPVEDGQANKAESTLETDVDMKDASDLKDPISSDAPEVTVPQFPSASDATHPVLKQYTKGFVELTKEDGILPPDFEAHISVSFWAVFWQMQLSDIYGALDLYDEEKAHYDKMQIQVKDDKSLSLPVRIAEAKKYSNLFMEAHKERIMRSTQLKTVRDRLSADKLTWLDRTPAAKADLHALLLEQCFFPRLKLTASDAHYAFQMMLFLHRETVPGFRLMYLLDTLFESQQLQNMIFSCTAREAENFGRFLNQLLSLLKRWHSDKAAYEAEAIGTGTNQFAGFAEKMNSATWSPIESMTHANFRQLLYKHQGHLYRALNHCLQDSEYMRIRNSLLILNRIGDAFPGVDVQGKALIESLQNLISKSKMQDVKLTATGVHAMLSKKNKSWMSIQQFRLGADAEQKPATSAPAAAKTQTAAAPATATLNAAAKAFQPNGDVSKKRSLKDDEEDGEIGEVDETKKPAEPTSVPLNQAAQNDIQAKIDNITTQSAKKAAVSTQKTSPVPTAEASSVKAPTGPQPAAIPAKESRQMPDQHTLRTAHALPNRPESAVPVGRAEERKTDRGPEQGRLPPHPENRRIDASTQRRNRSRSPQRDGQGSNYREPRDNGHSRDQRDRNDDRRDAGRSYSDTRLPDRAEPEAQAQNKAQSNGQANASGQLAPQIERGPKINSERAALIDREEAKVTGGPPQSRYQESSRPSSQRDIRPGPPERDGSRRFDTVQAQHDHRGRGSRPQSPQRGSDRPPMRGEPSRDDRRDERGHYPPHPSSRDAPLPPRDTRSSRDLFGSSQAPRAPVDLNHGRLTQDFSTQSRNQDPNYGRLNSSNVDGTPDVVPSASRGRVASGRADRNNPAGLGNRQEEPSSNNRSNDGPAGPPARRESQRNTRGAYNQNKDMSAPPTPSTDNASSGTTEMAGVHPSRLQQLNGAPTPLQTNSVSSPTVPAGPRNPQSRGSYTAAGSPVYSRFASNQPPGGASTPTSTTASDRDRERRGEQDRNDKRFSQLQSIVGQQSPDANRQAPFDRADRTREREMHDRDGPRGRHEDNADMGASIRGRASRQASSNHIGNSQHASGYSQGAPQDHPSAPNGHGRDEQYRDNMNDGARQLRQPRSPVRERTGNESRDTDSRGVRDERSNRSAGPNANAGPERDVRMRDDRDRGDREYGRDRGGPRGGPGSRDGPPQQYSSSNSYQDQQTNGSRGPPPPTQQQQRDVGMSRGGPGGPGSGYMSGDGRNGDGGRRGGGRGVGSEYGSGYGPGQGQNSMGPGSGPGMGPGQAPLDRRVSGPNKRRMQGEEAGPSPDQKRPRRYQ